MKKIILIIVLFFSVNTYALNLPDNLYSDKLIIYDLTEEKILHEKKSEEIASIASLTKIMTTITAIEKNSDLSKSMEITSDVFTGIPWDASVAGLKVGDKLTIEDLLYASILPSGADATQALAISSSGSVASFVKDMNELAKSIGVKNTKFKNVTGLEEEEHKSTASDVLRILKYALKNPTFKTIYCTKEYTLTNGLTVKATISGYSRSLGLDTSRILGSKTGFTSIAGLCISALTNINGHEVIIITLGAPPVIKEAYNVKDALNLISFLSTNYKEQDLIHEGDMVSSLPVELSNIDTYSVLSPKTVTKYLPSDYNKDNFKVIYSGVEKLTFNNKDKIGNIKYYYNDELLDESEVYLNVDIKINIPKILKKYKVLFILMILGVILLIYLKRKLKKRKRIRK